MLKVGSLFSGIGGIDLGLERTGGFKIVWFSEIEPYCIEVLKKHWPEVKNHGDITKIKWEDVERVDVLAGGFPCQDISVAGKGAGIIEGKRSSLWKYFAAAIRALRPSYVIIENVSALSNRGLDVVLANLAKEGYDAEWLDLRASDFGAPHKRERIFIIGKRSIRYNDFNSKDKKSEMACRKEVAASRISSASNAFGIRSGKESHPFQLQEGTSAEGDVADTESFRYDNNGYAPDGGNNPFYIATRNRKRQQQSKGNVENVRRWDNNEAFDSDHNSGRWHEGQHPLYGRKPNNQGSITTDFESKQDRGKPIVEYGGYYEGFLAHDWSKRVQRFREEALQGEQGFSLCEDVRRVEDFFNRSSIPEPLLRRKNHELSFTLDGNKFK